MRVRQETPGGASDSGAVACLGIRPTDSSKDKASTDNATGAGVCRVAVRAQAHHMAHFAAVQRVQHHRKIIMSCLPTSPVEHDAFDFCSSDSTRSTVHAPRSWEIRLPNLLRTRCTIASFSSGSVSFFPSSFLRHRMPQSLVPCFHGTPASPPGQRSGTLGAARGLLGGPEAARVASSLSSPDACPR